MNVNYMNSISLPQSNVKLNVLRLDLLHPIIQGNKFYKLKYNLAFAKEHQLNILTFGGAHSNHIIATAIACKKENIPSIGIIRGNSFKYESHTIATARENGMQVIFTEREEFRMLCSLNQMELQNKLQKDYNIKSNLHIIPEGGTNELGIKGASEILCNIKNDYDIFCCPVGTGGTITGIINSLNNQKEVIGFSSLKDQYLTTEVTELSKNKYSNWKISYDYHFGGYAKWNHELIDFINLFKKDYQIPLCPIYTGKMMYGIFDLIQKSYFKENTKILAIHTGGLQGVIGFNQANKNILH